MRYFIISLIILILSISCKKDDEINSHRWGTATALKNGEHWGAEISAINNFYPSDTGIIISLHSVNAAGFDKDFLGFFKVPTILDKHPLSLTVVLAADSLIGAEYLTKLSDGHVVGDIYYLQEDDSVEDYIEVTEISGDEIKGNFQVSFLRDTTIPPVSSSTPDSVIFTDGQFHTRIRH